MRLIDADKLKTDIAKWLNPRAYIEEPRMVEVDDISVSVIQTIDEQPTAYDADKVVAELKQEIQNGTIKIEVGNSRLFGIVKQGGHLIMCASGDYLTKK